MNLTSNFLKILLIIVNIFFAVRWVDFLKIFHDNLGELSVYSGLES